VELNIAACTTAFDHFLPNAKLSGASFASA
jgi:hypothetical protein